MKISGISSALLILMLTIFGCSDNSSVYEPIVSESFNVANKIPSPLIPKKISVTKIINGTSGGTIVLNGLYKNSSGEVITVHANLKIPKNAFNGIKTITISSDSVLAALNFSPAMEFDVPLNLNLVYTGLDLKSLGLIHDLVFAFLEDDGTFEPTKNDGIKTQLPLGALTVINAQLEHFSKFGFISARYGYSRVTKDKHRITQ